MKLRRLLLPAIVTIFIFAIISLVVGRLDGRTVQASIHLDDAVSELQLGKLRDAGHLLALAKECPIPHDVFEALVAATECLQLDDTRAALRQLRKARQLARADRDQAMARAEAIRCVQFVLLTIALVGLGLAVELRLRSRLSIDPAIAAALAAGCEGAQGNGPDLLCGKKGNVEWASQRFYAMTSLEPAHVLGQHLATLATVVTGGQAFSGQQQQPEADASVSVAFSARAACWRMERVSLPFGVTAVWLIVPEPERPDGSAAERQASPAELVVSRLADAAHVANAALERLDGADEMLELHAETLQAADAIDEVCGDVHRLQAANQIFADRLSKLVRGKVVPVEVDPGSLSKAEQLAEKLLSDRLMDQVESFRSALAELREVIPQIFRTIRELAAGGPVLP